MTASSSSTLEQTTDALASDIGVKPGSIRVRYCRTGSYFGLVPRKLVNGRLLWPPDAKARLTRGNNSR